MIIKRKITTLTTDSNGQATYRYDSAGIGDITFAVDFKGNDSSVLSESYTIRDAMFYDASSSTNVSKYTIPAGASMTYDSTENAYVINYTENAYGQKAILLNNIPLSRKVTIRCDVKYCSGGNNQIRLGLMNNNIIGGRIGFNYGDCNVMRYPQNSVSGESSLVSQSGVTYSTSEWYTMEMTYDNGAVTYTVYNSNNTQIATMSTTETELSTSNTLTISQGVNTNSSTYVRNIQIF